MTESSDSNFYSILLRAAEVSQQEWLAEEYTDGRINEKQFLERLLVEMSEIPRNRERIGK